METTSAAKVFVGSHTYGFSGRTDFDQRLSFNVYRLPFWAFFGQNGSLLVSRFGVMPFCLTSVRWLQAKLAKADVNEVENGR
jgi:hypothetical protein